MTLDRDVALQQGRPGRAVAEAGTNIAIVKYWGKRAGSSPGLNLPAVGSLSLTLGELHTRTEVRFDAALDADSFALADEPITGGPLQRTSRFLDLVRARAGIHLRAAVRSRNSFPTAAGLASSASGFAALAVAASSAAGLSLDGKALSQLARMGSGSAARSIFGGFVLLHRGERDDGADCYAEPLHPGPIAGAAVGAPPAPWDLRMVIGIAGEGPKQTLSTDGMGLTSETSPYFRAWVESHPADLLAAREAIEHRDLAALGEIAERSCLTMHASALAARPGVIYWTGATVDGFHAVRALRKRGVATWFTNDAGPHVKALCSPEDATRVAETLAAIPGISRAVVCVPGGPARVVESTP